MPSLSVERLVCAFSLIVRDVSCVTSGLGCSVWHCCASVRYTVNFFECGIVVGYSYGLSSLPGCVVANPVHQLCDAAVVPAGSGGSAERGAR